MERRDFLKIAGTATVATTLPGCTPKEPKSLLPYIIPDEEIIPGRSVVYATVCRECPAGCGMNVRVREGRATKAEGNPLHPVNKGALCARGQASLQGLYNPDRIQAPMRKTAAGTWEQLSWEEAHEVMVTRLQEIRREGKGRGIAWVSQHETGSLDRLIDDWLKGAGSAQRYRFEPINHEALKRANVATFGYPELPRYDLSKADTIVSFATDFLETWLSPVEFAGQLAVLRGGNGEQRGYVIYVGPRLSMTASNADLWLNVAPEDMGVLALTLVNIVLAHGALAVSGEERRKLTALVENYSPEKVAPNLGLDVEQLAFLGEKVKTSRSVVALAGGPLLESEDGIRTLVAVNLLNYVCGAMGKSVDFGHPTTLSHVSSYKDILGLMTAMEESRVPALFLSDVNPVFALPSGDRFAAAISKIPFVVSFSSLMDETTELATLILPTHTPLEAWGDFEPYRGVHGLMQPVMEPVFKTKMLGDVLLETGKKLYSGWSAYPSSFALYVKEQWKGVQKKVEGNVPFETFWSESLARGGAWEHVQAKAVQLTAGVDRSLLDPKARPVHLDAELFSLVAYPSIAHYDGRGASRPWLQELPDPMTRLTWGTWVEINAEVAARMDIRTGDAVSLTSSTGEIQAGAFVSSGIRKGVVAVPMGLGHTAFGRYAKGVGANPVRLLDAAPSSSGGMQLYGATVRIRKGSGRRYFASVQETGSEHHRELARTISADQLKEGTAPKEAEAPTIYPHGSYAKHQWGMTIDLDKCTGCAACVAACYAENNIPVVGIDEVINGREMAWLRVDRYYQEEEDAEGAGRARFLPMFCQQCGAAPCETVCPVYAAYHTEEGLNGQVYNRCIGTRYCANNCPYKVRRFNWFRHEWPAPLNWQLNPDVTVRTSGVMEKCTFCVQRIVEAKNNARLEKRTVRDGEIRTACQQTCPARAINFVDRKQNEGRMADLVHDDSRAYHVLEELNTLPAVTYLKRIMQAKGA